eukprot:2636552-Prymnesium_polylepis.2
MQKSQPRRGEAASGVARLGPWRVGHGVGRVTRAGARRPRAPARRTALSGVVCTARAGRRARAPRGCSSCQRATAKEKEVGTRNTRRPATSAKEQRSTQPSRTSCG